MGTELTLADFKAAIAQTPDGQALAARGVDLNALDWVAILKAFLPIIIKLIEDWLNTQGR